MTIRDPSVSGNSVSRRTVQAPDAATDQRALPPIESWDDAQPRAAGHSTLRLQPVILGPPPEAGFRDASAEDDLDLRDLTPKRSTGVFAALAALVVVVLTAGSAYFFLAGRDPVQSNLPPVIQASPEPLKQPVAELPKDVIEKTEDRPRLSQSPTVIEPSPGPGDVAIISPVVPSASGPAQQQIVPKPSERLDMGSISTELVPPTTEGLSPPRRVQAVRIMVENDREMPPR